MCGWVAERPWRLARHKVSGHGENENSSYKVNGISNRMMIQIFRRPFRTENCYPINQPPCGWLISRVPSAQTQGSVFALGPKHLRTGALRFVPQGQPEISQTRSVWFAPPKKFVLKGRRISIELIFQMVPSSLQDEKRYWINQPPCGWLIS